MITVPVKFHSVEEIIHIQIELAGIAGAAGRDYIFDSVGSPFRQGDDMILSESTAGSRTIGALVVPHF